MDEKTGEDNKDRDDLLPDLEVDSALMCLVVVIREFTSLEEVSSTEDEVEVEPSGNCVNKEGDPAENRVSLDHLAFAENGAKETTEKMIRYRLVNTIVNRV